MNLPDKYRGNALTPTAGASALSTPINHASEDRLDLRFLISIFRRRFRLFLAVALSGLMLALLITLYMPKRYEAVADVVINTNNEQVVPDQTQANSPEILRNEGIETELKVIRSIDMASQVVTDLKLDQDKDFVASVTGGSGLRATLLSMIGQSAPLPPMGDIKRALADALLSSLKATRLENAYAIHLAYQNTNPVRAAAIANSFARLYTGSAVTTKHGENQKSLELLKTRMEELRLQATQDFQAVQTFRVSNGLLSKEATSLAEQEAGAYSQQLAAARAAAAADRGRANTAGGAAMQATLSSPTVQSLRSQRAALSIKVAELSGKYLDGHPLLVEARLQLNDIDNQISRETSRVIAGTTTGISATAQASSQQVGSLQANLSAARATLARNNRALVGLDDLTRRAEASQSLYESYLNRYKELLAQSGTERPEARLLSGAKVPAIPVSPNMPLNLALGLLIGTLFGAGAAIATESAYAGLTTGHEVESRLGVRYLGGVPSLRSLDIAETSALDVISKSPGSAFAESFRGLITATRATANSRNQVIAVSSALPGEGKTSIASCLARLMAQSGETVIVIDCDLVRHALSERFTADKAKPGLREIVHGTAKLGDTLIKDPHSEAMILPITTPFADGERLLEKGNFHKLIAALREHFTLIILDTAPILPFAETRELVTLADNIIISTLWRKTPDTAVRAALRLLPPQSSLGDVGIALNKIDMKKQARFGAGDASYYYNVYKEYYAQA